jgi:hypothetical protein
VGEAGLEVTCGACHDRLIVAGLVDLSRITSWAKTHCEVRYITKCGKEGFLVVSTNKVSLIGQAFEMYSESWYLSNASAEAQTFTLS